MKVQVFQAFEHKEDIKSKCKSNCKILKCICMDYIIHGSGSQSTISQYWMKKCY